MLDACSRKENQVSTGLIVTRITIFHASSFFTLRLLPKIAFSQLLGEVKPSPPAEMIVPLSESDAEYSLPFEKKGVV